jgi:DNA mismatch endonuclease (patch repair protein)
MVANRRRDTTPELAVRRELHRRGLRFRVDYPVLPRRRADIAFPRRRVAVFIDGCFWHDCPEHGTASKANAEFWAEKLAANKTRDRDTDLRLGEVGWTVLRFWEHEGIEDVVRRIEATVRASVP